MNILKKLIKWTVIGVLGISLLSFLFGNKQPTTNETPQNETAPTTTPNTVFSPSEEEINTLADNYCQQRKGTSRVYPVPVKTGLDNTAEYEVIDDSRKAGSSLTSNDCQLVIQYLIWMKNKAFPVADINIESIVERKYWIGMNVAELMASVGWPSDINTTNYGSGKTEQWVYYKDSSRINALMIYLDEHGKVTSYQDF